MPPMEDVMYENGFGIFVSEPGECERNCVEDADCQGYTLVVDSSVCILYVSRLFMYPLP